MTAQTVKLDRVSFNVQAAKRHKTFDAFLAAHKDSTFGSFIGETFKPHPKQREKLMQVYCLVHGFDMPEGDLTKAEPPSADDLKTEAAATPAAPAVVNDNPPPPPPPLTKEEEEDAAKKAAKNASRK